MLRSLVRSSVLINPVWLAMTKTIDFSRPDGDEVKLHAAIMKSEGLPRPRAVSTR